MAMKMRWFILGLALLSLSACHHKDPIAYLAGSEPLVSVTDEDNQEEITLTRGQTVYLDQKDEAKHLWHIYILENDQKHYYWVSMDHVTKDYQKVVTVETVTSNLLVNLRPDRQEPIVEQILQKGETVRVVSVNMERDFNVDDGTVDGYMIEKDGKRYYLNALYTQPEIEQKEDIYYSTFFDSWYGEGYSKKTYIDELTYLALDRTEFAGKPLKKDARAVHVGMSIVYEQQDYLIDLCNTTGIDTLVLELKADDGRLIFESDTAKQFLKEPSLTQTTSISKEEFAQLVKKYHEHGIYLIGRIVTFKDPIFVSSYPSEAISYRDGSHYIHDGLAWPSPYSRKAWQYVVGYAKEAVAMGIDEIQFDYVRFPDGMEDGLDLKNSYQESKAQAISNFLYYAREELHEMEAYIGADVFGWNMICGDDQDIGQFVPSIASIVDVISPMPYPDHFGAGSLGIMQPWQNPGALLEAFTKTSQDILATVPSPAVFRSWIQGYSCLSWVCDGTSDNPYRGYGPDELIAQIQGIRNAGETGYIVWSGDGGRDMFEWRKSGFIE